MASRAREPERDSGAGCEFVEFVTAVPTLRRSMDVDARSSREEEAREDIASRRIARRTRDERATRARHASRCVGISNVDATAQPTTNMRASTGSRPTRASRATTTLVLMAWCALVARASASACRETAARVDEALRAHPRLGRGDGARAPGRTRVMTHGRSELDIEDVLDGVLEACAREGDEACVERVRARRDLVEARAFARGVEGAGMALCEDEEDSEARDEL